MDWTAIKTTILLYHRNFYSKQTFRCEVAQFKIIIIKKNFKDSYHGIITKFVHEVRCLGAFIVVEPNSSLKLVTRIQKQDVLLLSPDLRHLREPPGDPREARTPGWTLPRVLAGLLDPCVVIVGVEQSHVESRRSPRAVKKQRETERGQESAAGRPSGHRVAVRKNARMAKDAQWATGGRRGPFLQDVFK